MSDKPRFRFPVMSWGDSRRFAVLQARLRRLGREDCSPEETAACFDELQQMLARLVVSVPREWLVEGAPEHLDWSDPASFDWLIADRIADLQQALIEARSPEVVSGNSEAR